MSEYNDHTTAETDKNERLMAEVIERKWNCRLHKMPDWYSADFVAYEDGKSNFNPVRAFIEVKRVKNSSTKYNNMICPLHKYQKIMALAASGGVKPILAFWFTDGLYWLDMFMPFDRVVMVKDDSHDALRDKMDFSPHVVWEGKHKLLSTM